MKTVLAAVDFSPVTERIVDLAMKIAAPHKANLHLLHVVHSLQEVYVGFSLANQEYYGSMGPLYIPDESILKQLRSQAQEEEAKLNALAAKVQAAGIVCTPILLQGEVSKVLVEESTRLGADICILGTHGHSLVYKAFLGSTSEYVISHSSCPVLLVPRKTEDESTSDADQTSASE